MRHELLMAEQDQRPGQLSRFLPWTLLTLGGIERAVGWGGSIDFILARWDEPAWVGVMLNALMEYSSPIGLALLIGGFLGILWHERKRNDLRYRADGATTAIAVEEVQPERVEAAVMPELTSFYVGICTVDIGKMDTDHRVDICIIAYNGNSLPVRATHLEGNISLSMRNSAGETIAEQLSAPVLEKEQGHALAMPNSEFLLVLHQYVTKKQATMIKSCLQFGTVTFDLRKLIICLATSGYEYRGMIKFNRSPNISCCEHGDIKQNYTVFAHIRPILG